MLWMAAASCAVGALGLVLAGLRPPPPPLTIDQAHALEQGVHVRVLGQVPDARRYLLSEGRLYVADPREPRYPLYLAMIQIKLGQDGPAMASGHTFFRSAPPIARPAPS